MNWQHLTAFLWLRWRLWINQWRRAGSLIVLLMLVVAAMSVATAVPLFIGCFIAGTHLIPRAEPVHLMYAWDGVLVGFAFFWMIGLITELQRTEPLSLSKLLHLPVSVNGAFLINYISSLLRLSLIVFVPIMLGFCLALVYVKGGLFILALPLMAAFLLMVTALTYQFQGWLASLMNNPRRRRTVVVVTTMIFVLIVQLPNVLNISTGFWGTQKRGEQRAKLQQNMDEEFLEQLDKLSRQAIEPGADLNAIQRRMTELTVNQRDDVAQRVDHAMQQTNAESLKELERTAGIVNLAVPLGWMPLGVMALAKGNAVPSLLGILGMTLIGSASLWRAYRTTIGLYQGRFTKQTARPAPAIASHAVASPRGVQLLERRLPGFSEPVSAVALAALRSLMRSPEAKMMLLTLLVMGGIFGTMLFQAPPHVPELARPLVAIGAMTFVLFCMLQMMSNQFGFDRDGFRVFVLCAAPRRDILLGKNLAFVPMTLGMAAIMLVIAQLICPMRLDHFLAMLPQFVSMFLLFCIMTNLLSIYAPLHIAAGSLKPSHPRIGTVLLQLAMFTLIFPLTQIPTLIPLGVEAGLEFQDWSAGAPICLLLSLVECALVILIYRFSLNWQGNLLQDREMRILESVTNRLP